jgi:hypothetical protein
MMFSKICIGPVVAVVIAAALATPVLGQLRGQPAERAPGISAPTQGSAPSWIMDPYSPGG